MFIAIIFIAIGLAILLNTLGITTGSFWGFFWAILFIAVGIKMMLHRNSCPGCEWKFWEETKRGKEDGCCGHHHSHDIEE